MMLLLIGCFLLGTGSCAPRTSRALGFLTDAFLDEAPLALERAASAGHLADFDDSLQDPLPDPTDRDAALSSRVRANSPIYYIRLPPEPYVFVPGLGYVSRPPQLRPPPVVQPGPESNLLRLPVKFVSNAKPTGVYQWKPNKPDSPVTHLDKGPYLFNGKPTDLFLLRNTYNSLYDDTLHNFYP